METATKKSGASPRTERICVRVATAQKDIIQQAAARRGMTISAFILAEADVAAKRIMETRSSRTPGTFEVLCRIDAFADYVAEVEAYEAEEAAALAHENHSDYKWEHRFTQEFDACFYVTLDDAGNEIEETQMGDF